MCNICTYWQRTSISSLLLYVPRCERINDGQSIYQRKSHQFWGCAIDQCPPNRWTMCLESLTDYPSNKTSAGSQKRHLEVSEVARKESNRSVVCNCNSEGGSDRSDKCDMLSLLRVVWTWKRFEPPVAEIISPNTFRFFRCSFSMSGWLVSMSWCRFQAASHSKHLLEYSIPRFFITAILVNISAHAASATIQLNTARNGTIQNKCNIIQCIIINTIHYYKYNLWARNSKRWPRTNTEN